MGDVPRKDGRGIKQEDRVVLRLALEDEHSEISHQYKNWNFTEAEPDTIHAYIDAIAILLKSATFSEERI